jgi:predicted glycosyltransferase
MSAGVCADQASISYRYHDNIIAVDAIDIIDIISKYNDDDEIIIKMDIEGSEFMVLRRLLEDPKCCKRVKKIFIEWHTCYMKNESEETRDDIISRLSNLGIELMNNWM